MNNTPTKKSLSKMIERRKRKLVEYAKKNGFHENLGEKEVRELYDKIDMEEKYGEKGKMIDNFLEWAISLDLNSPEMRNNKK